MYLQGVAALAFSLSALAAPTDKGPSPDRPSLQVLNYNNLGSQNNGTSTVLVLDGLSYSDAEDQCSSIGEELYPFADAPQANRTELKYQFDYLVYNHDLPCDAFIWVAGDDCECMAYSYKSKELVQKPCDTQLPALCSSTVPPTTDKDRTAVESSKLPLAFDGWSLTGYRDARSFRFLGIPFADPPVDELRLAPPEPYTGSKEIDATVYSDSCIQSASSFGTHRNRGISEDCLYLNVYSPVLPSQGSNSSRPVAVYFYGGAFTSGSASMVDYDGGNFASRNDVIVVTVNYRVGALGFLSTGNLTTGSYGTRDQIMALRWVNKHISAFGGDPSRVTIFGQSAGGQSVVAMLSSSAASDLFSGAIVQSAPVDLPWYTREVYGELIAPEVAKAVGCEDFDTEEAMVKCLRSVPPLNYLDNSTDFEDAMSASAKSVSSEYLHVSSLLASIEPLMPVVDDTNSGVIDNQFHTLLSQGKLPNRVPTMFTTVTDEASLYVDQKVPSLGSTQAGLDIVFNIAFPSDLADKLIDAEVFPVNKSSDDGTRNAAADALTCSEWTCPEAYLLSKFSSAFPKLYEVEIDDGHVQTTVDVPEICSPNPDMNVSCHSSDVLPVWGTLDAKTMGVDPYYGRKDLLHSQMMDDIFGAFFRTHDPNPDPKWLKVRGPAYAASYGVFGKNGYHIDEFVPHQRNLSRLGFPPSQVENPGVTDQCQVFTDYGYTFQHAEFDE